MFQMKESGIGWLGAISNQVKLMPLKYILLEEKTPIKVGPFGSQLSGSDFLNEESEYWVYNQRMVIDNNYTEGDAFISKEKYQSMPGFHIKTGDILITTRGSIGKISRVPAIHKAGILHPCIIRFRIDESKFNYQLLQIIFNESDFISRQLLYKSNATTIDVLYSDTLRNLLLPVWNIDLQNNIASFLDAMCKKIDSLSANIQSQIEILEQYKQSVITEAVTKGLYPDAEMKQSGIQYAGKIPAHWNVHPLYYYFGERKNKNIFGQEDNLLSLSYGKIIRKDISSNGGLLPESFNTYNIIESGDIIIRPTDLQNDKRSLRTGVAKEKGIITSAYIALKPIKQVNTSYFHYLLHSFDVMKVFYNMGNGVRQGLNFSEFSRLMVFEPPISEQNEIVKYLDKKCSEIDNIISAKKEQLSTIEDYKKSLIYEYVTGKKEVPVNASY